jgi:hypothetical protein
MPLRLSSSSALPNIAGAYCQTFDADCTLSGEDCHLSLTDYNLFDEDCQVSRLLPPLKYAQRCKLLP